MRLVASLVLLLVLAALLVFALENTQAVTLHFLAWSVSAPVAFLVIGVYVLGMLSGAWVVALLNRLLRRVTTR